MCMNKPPCYPQQLGRSWNVFVPERCGNLSAMCTGTFQNLIRYLPRNPPEPHQLSAPEPSGTSSAFCTGTLQNLVCYLHRNPNHPEPHQPSAQGPSGTSSAICTRTRRNLISHLHRNRNLVCWLHRNPLEPRQPSVPEPARTLSAICTGTIRNFISHLHRNPPEPCLLSAPELSGTSSAICAGTRRNLISFLHRNRPEPSGTFRNLLRNLGLQLHQIAPELFWAKDPIASLAGGEKITCNSDSTNTLKLNMYQAKANNSGRTVSKYSWSLQKLGFACGHLSQCLPCHRWLRHF